MLCCFALFSLFSIVSIAGVAVSLVPCIVYEYLILVALPWPWYLGILVSWNGSTFPWLYWYEDVICITNNTTI